MIENSRDYATCDLKSPEGRGEKDDIGEELRFYANGSVAKIDISAPKEDAKEVRRLQRAMDRSLRAVNPDNYNENGTTKKGARKWVRSKHYLALQAELADLKRRGVETRRNIHGRVVRILVGSAGTIRVEENNWKALQRGRYGKSVLNGAPPPLPPRNSLNDFEERLKALDRR